MLHLAGNAMSGYVLAALIISLFANTDLSDRVDFYTGVAGASTATLVEERGVDTFSGSDIDDDERTPIGESDEESALASLSDSA